MLASADHPIGPRLEVGDFTVSARWPILRSAVIEWPCATRRAFASRSSVPLCQRISGRYRAGIVSPEPICRRFAL